MSMFFILSVEIILLKLNYFVFTQRKVIFYRYEKKKNIFSNLKKEEFFSVRFFLKIVYLTGEIKYSMYIFFYVFFLSLSQSHN